LGKKVYRAAKGSNLMNSNKYCKSAAAALGVMAMASNAGAVEGGWNGSYGSGAPYFAGSQDPYAQLSLDQKIAILREKVKYVFVIFHENESFDHYFGTYPGADGLFEAPPGFTPRSAALAGLS
jgi:phospholipase C